MSKRKNITQPDDWWPAWVAQAKKEGKSLSAWMGERCNEGLPEAVRKTLSKRQPAHRPKSKSNDE